MRKRKILLVLLAGSMLSGCSFVKNVFSFIFPGKEKGELVIPTVDVDSLHINLPNKPTRNYSQSDIKTDGTYDYLNFYEVSDFHGAIEYQEGSTSTNIGLAKMAGYFESLRNENKGGTVILSSGDMFQGSAESNLTRGYLVNYCMNYMGFESMTLGNHEFDWGAEWIKKNSELKYNNYSIPFLGANITENSTGQLPSYLKKSVVIERGNYKIGIIGTIGKELKTSILKTNVENFTFGDEAAAVKAEAGVLRQQGCDVVIWASHNAADSLSKAGVTKEDGIDAIFGGHAHVNSATTSSDIPVVATLNYGRGIGAIELKINKTTKEVTCSSYDALATKDNSAAKNSSENADINSIISQYNSEINKIKNIKLGSTPVKLDNTISGQLKNLCVDAMQSSTRKFLTDNADFGISPDLAVVAYHNVNGGIRSDIEKGTITYGDVYKPFPFDNEIVLFKATGRQISGFGYNTNIQGYAVWHSFKKDKSDLDYDKEYYVITTDFLALGENFKKADEDLIRTGLNVRDEIAKYIYKIDKVDVSIYDTQNFRSIESY